MRWLLIIGSCLFLLGVRISGLQKAPKVQVTGPSEWQLDASQTFEQAFLLLNTGAQSLLEEREDHEPLYMGQREAVHTAIQPNHQRSKHLPGGQLSFKSHYPPPEEGAFYCLNRK